MQVLTKLENIIKRLLLIMFEILWQSGEVFEALKKKIIPFWPQEDKKDTGDYRLVSLTSVCGRVMGQIMPGIISSHEDQGKSHFTNLVASTRKWLAWWIREEQKVASILLFIFDKVFFAVSPNIFTDKLHKYILHKWGRLEVGRTGTDRIKVFLQMLYQSIDMRANIVK